MNKQQTINYERIARAIAYIKSNFREQPTLEDIAGHVSMSPFHFQKLFTEWAGVSPKKFTQFISIEYARRLLKEKSATLFDVAHETGLTGTGRLHDLFVKIEAMSPGEYKNGGEKLNIEYSFSESPFGKLLVASTLRGICHIAFISEEELAVLELKGKFPRANFRHGNNNFHKSVFDVFDSGNEGISPIILHIKGTPFQLKVWEALLKIPRGYLSTYGELANEIDNKSASRAVGSAIGSNPIAFLIPCHRVIRSGGDLGGYRWGNIRKAAIIGWEAAKTQNDS